ncbi:30S ribosomal protein S30 [Sediminicola sp. YIK13]|uniref:HPF/RaiA family ribosome-associated protein n=1 Tax=Sediminicola sp. YIK13 TaxID=1453352 RepID=UPI00071FCBCA|nr:HPF/RaiA family ribosome-associated protein [Sediminicola sp. YIK13]ALM06890.1 30S ribosomal protein S30 [Sediminicola sp. YIK13]
MTIDVQYVKMPTSEATTEFVTKKLDKLGDRYNWVIAAKVYFKLENNPSGKGKICEIELSAPGPRLFAKSNEAHFEKAAVATINDLERQLKKTNEKRNKKF